MGLGVYNALQFETDGSVIEQVRPDEEDETKTRPERVILCAVCGHEITAEKQRVRVHGAHEHRFMNPHGFLFDIGCFREAPGCRIRGVPSTEFTWFPGFAWSHAVCGGCTEHLGWRFTGGEGVGFFGLVLNRLVSFEREGEGEAGGPG